MSTDAAVLMLKKKIHRLPIVNQDKQVIGEYQNGKQLRDKRTECIYTWFVLFNIDDFASLMGF